MRCDPGNDPNKDYPNLDFCWCPACIHWAVWEDGENTDTVTYVLHSPALNLVKIGKTTNLTRRFRQACLSSPDPHLHIVGWFIGDWEGWLHARFSCCRAHGEWFTLDHRFSAIANLIPDTELAFLQDWVRLQDWVHQRRADNAS